MNFKQFGLILLIVAAAAGIANLLINKRDSSLDQAGQRMGDRVLSEFPVNTVSELRFQPPGKDAFSLHKVEDSWRVKERDDYPADFNKIRNFLVSLRELKITQPVEAGPSQYGRLGLLPSTETKKKPAAKEKEEDQEPKNGTDIAFLDADGKSVAGIRFGKQLRDQSGSRGSGMARGRYILLDGAKNPVSLVSQTLNEVDDEARRWLNKDFFSVSKAKSVEIVSGDAERKPLQFFREKDGDDIQLEGLAENEKLKTYEAGQAGRAFAYGSFEDVLGREGEPEKSGLAKPTKVKIETFEGFNYTIQIGEARKPDDENGDTLYPLTVKVEADLPEPEKKEEVTEKEEEKDEAGGDAEKTEEDSAAEKKSEPSDKSDESDKKPETKEGAKEEEEAEDKDEKADEKKSEEPVKEEAGSKEEEKSAVEKKPEDKNSIDDEEYKKLKEKLENERRLAGWVYLMRESDVDDLLKKREEFVEPKEEEKKEETPNKADTPEADSG